MHQVALRYKMYENEVRFYQELAAELDIRTPKSYLQIMTLKQKTWCYLWSLWTGGILRIRFQGQVMRKYV